MTTQYPTMALAFLRLFCAVRQSLLSNLSHHQGWSMDRRMAHGWMDGWVNGWMDGWMDGSLTEIFFTTTVNQPDQKFSSA
jgi:hypothetical protein